MCESAGGGSYLLAPAGWAPNDPNPFRTDGAYGPGWSCFQVEDADNDRRANGRTPSGLYCFRVGRRCERLWERLADFVTYEPSVGRRPIIACPPDLNAPERIVRALSATPPAGAVRPGDPVWLVHSTSLSSWSAIRECGELRAASLLLQQGLELPMVGTMVLGDPPDYADHIDLGKIDSIGAEYVVACQSAGRLLDDSDTAYQPGARLYFDAHRIIRDGLAIRDGLHELKVRWRLPLNPYLAAAISVGDVDPGGAVAEWRTSSFLAASNELFLSRAGTPEEFRRGD